MLISKISPSLDFVATGVPVFYKHTCFVYWVSMMKVLVSKLKVACTSDPIFPREDAGGLSREYVLRISSVS